MSQNSAQIALLQKLVDQMKVEASIERVTLSQASKNLCDFVLEAAKEDPLLVKMSKSENPWVESGTGCFLF